MRALSIVLTLGILACAPKPVAGPTSKQPSGPTSLPPPPPTQAAQGPTCESAIGNSVTLTLAAASDANRDTLRAELDVAKPKMIAACHEDKWSPQLLDCLDRARTDAATGTCTELLTPAQQDGVSKRLSSS